MTSATSKPATKTLQEFGRSGYRAETSKFHHDVHAKRAPVDPPCTGSEAWTRNLRSDQDCLNFAPLSCGDRESSERFP